MSLHTQRNMHSLLPTLVDDATLLALLAPLSACPGWQQGLAGGFLKTLPGLEQIVTHFPPAF